MAPTKQIALNTTQTYLVHNNSDGLSNVPKPKDTLGEKQRGCRARECRKHSQESIRWVLGQHNTAEKRRLLRTRLRDRTKTGNKTHIPDGLYYDRFSLIQLAISS